MEKLYFENNIRFLRKQKGLEVSEMAKKLGYAEKTIRRWEEGEVSPRLDVLLDYAEFFNAGLEDLVFKNLEAEEK